MEAAYRLQRLRHESGLQRRTWQPCHLGCTRAAPLRGGQTAAAVSSSSRETVLLQEVLEQLKTMNNRIGKLSKQVQRLETRVFELYEFTCLPHITSHFSNEFAESVDLRSAAHIVDQILDLALTLDLPPALKQRGVLISILEDYVLKERAGLRAALKSLIDEACEEAGVCMVSLPSSFQTAPWDDIRACLQELQLGLSSPAAPHGDDRITNLLRLVDALEREEASHGPPPRPLPGFMEMATALAAGGASGGCRAHVALDCRGRIDVRETYIEFHFGAFQGVDQGFQDTCRQLRRAAALFVWTYRVLEPHIQAGRKARDVEAVGYTFSIGKVAPQQDVALKLFDEFSVEVGGRRSQADVAYRYFSVRPTGLHEHYAKV